MADENENTQPPASDDQTSSVPVKKETVRATLKADPPAPSAPAPPAPAPTIPLKSAPAPSGAPTPPPAPSAGGAPAPAPTIPLKTAPGPATVPLATSPAPGAAAPTTALPQATVQLESTQQLGNPTAPTMSTIGTIAMDDDEEEESGTLPMVASILAFVLSLAVLALSIMMWTTNNEKTFGQLFE